MSPEKPGDLLHDILPHDLRAAAGSIDMTVGAVQVAQVAQVDLQGLEVFKGFILRIYRLQALLKRD